MLDVKLAQDMVLQNTPAGRKTVRPLAAARDHYLAADVAADRDVPPFNRSAMDGYAVRAEDVRATPATLNVLGESRAGLAPQISVRPGQAVRIMTGAAVPDGADGVQMVEKTESLDDGCRVRILEAVETGANIAPRGHEVHQGEVVLAAGRYLGAAELAVLATFGQTEVTVWQKPTAALLATGDELVDVGTTPTGAQIRNSNSYALQAQLELLGLRAENLGVARDNKEDLRAKIGRGLSYDFLLITGGVSMGQYDLVEDVFAEFGVRVFFEQVAIKPGKPVVVGRKGDALVFGLPGNPVSSYVTFECFVRPALLQWMGRPHHGGLQSVTAQLKQRVKQKPGRTAFLPAWTDGEEGGWRVEALPSKGSADIVAFSRCNSLLVFPKDEVLYETGATVSVLLLDDFFRRVRV